MSDGVKHFHPIATERSAAGPRAAWIALRQAADKVGLIAGPRLLLRSNQRAGFDCPGCAWPDPLGKRKLVEFCENGAKAVADEATRARVSRTLFEQYSVVQLAQQPDRWLNDQGRLTEPMLKPAGSDHYHAVNWDEALGLIATHLRALRSPDQAAFYTSGRTANETAFLYQLMVRRFGSNNFPDCSNLCHESSGSALTEVLGSGKGSVTLDDFDQADLILVVGQNPGSNHPRMLATLQQAKRRGARIITINPLNETGMRRYRNPQELRGLLGSGTALTDCLLRVVINGDGALFQGLAKSLLARGAVDQPFIDEFTDGFQPLRRHLEALDWPEIEAASGVSRPQIEHAGGMIAESRAMICCWAMGITQHQNAVATIQNIVNVMLLGGHLGRPGAGVCPVRGHSNVQGDRTMGIWEKPGADFLDALEHEFGFTPPRHEGMDAVATIHGMYNGRIKVLFCMGGNLAGASPDHDYTARALANCELTVQVSTKLNRSHTVTGQSALILPTLGRTEMDCQSGRVQYVTVEDSMGAIRKSRGGMEPAAVSLKSELRIVSDLALKLFGKDDVVDWGWLADDYDRVRDHIARVIPGFENFNSRMQREGEFLLPHPVRDQRLFHTVTGKARFTVHDPRPPRVPEGHFLMTTLRSHDQFNTTVYSDNDRYRGISGGRRVLLMNPEDMAQVDLQPEQKVTINSHFAGQVRSLTGFTLVPFDIPAGCVAGYYPETNPLVAIGSVAAGSNTPAYKSIVVAIAPAHTTRSLSNDQPIGRGQPASDET